MDLTAQKPYLRMQCMPPIWHLRWYQSVALMMQTVLFYSKIACALSKTLQDVPWQSYLVRKDYTVSLEHLLTSLPKMVVLSMRMSLLSNCRSAKLTESSDISLMQLSVMLLRKGGLLVSRLTQCRNPSFAKPVLRRSQPSNHFRRSRILVPRSMANGFIGTFGVLL